MDLSFEQNDWQQAIPSGDSLDSCDHSPEWHALRSRMAAALSARREISRAEPKVTETPKITETDGSFNQRSAKVLTGFEGYSHLINLTALGNGKSSGGIEAHTAGESRAGGRGNP
jgi:hypothetical protein